MESFIRINLDSYIKKLLSRFCMFIYLLFIYIFPDWEISIFLLYQVM